jgi:HD-like signal output (HDOD) protein
MNRHGIAFDGIGQRALRDTGHRNPNDCAPTQGAAEMNTDHVPAFTLTPATPRSVDEMPRTHAIRVPKFIDDVSAGRVELPIIPGVVQKLISALRDPDVDTRTIGDALSRDPVLSAKVLRIANSSHFGAQRSMASIDAAVAMIGNQALNRVVVACGVASAFEAVPGIDLRIFWRDASVAATAAHALAPLIKADPEEAHLCGLLHAIGHLILCRSYPEIADAMFTGFAIVRGEPLARIELDAFGIDHRAVGALWAEHLGFPKAVAIAIAAMATPDTSPQTRLAIVLRSACALTAAVEQGDVAAGLCALAPALQARCIAADGSPSAAFTRLYDSLRTVEPMV